MAQPLLRLFMLALLLGSALLSQAQAGRQLKGRVLDKSSGTGLPGAAVVVENTNNGTSTDADGGFTLQVPGAGPVRLVVSYVGYVAQTVTATDGAALDVALSADQKSLNEVVVIGYGTQKRSDVTGSIISVKEEDLKKVPAANVMESLQGRLPGVDITRSSGASNSGVNITVRGNRSLTANNGPLFIVDGIQYTSIQDINPNDIASMEVLKDAASTAIYGSRGANGVIIVTTKKGASGKTTVTVNSYAGVTDVALYPLVNDAAGYIAQRREAYRTTGQWNSPADDSKIFSTFQQKSIADGVSTSWPKEFLKQGMQQEHQVGLAGGGDHTKFYLSLDYYNEKGNLRLDNLDRYSGRINLEHAVSPKFKVGTQSQLTYFNQNNRRDPLNIANKVDPLAAPYDASGNLAVYPNSGSFINPLSDEVNGNYENNIRTMRTFITAYADWQVLPDLNFRSNVGLTLGNARTGQFQGSNTVDRNGSVPLSSYATQFDTNWSWENILNYNKTFGDHSLTLTGVTSLLTFNTESSRAQGANQLLGYQLYYALGNANQQLNINSGYSNSKLISFSGRAQYNYKSRYLLTLTGRSDGSSKLAKGNKWAFFPSAAAAWRISEENFLKDQTLISDLKLRVSYGLAGNYDIPPYSSQSLLTRIPFAYGETSAPGYAFSNRIGNPDLKWELSTTANVGLDFGLLKNRLTGSVDVYETNTRDLLLDRVLPYTSGVSVITQNVGKTRNRGVELGLNALVMQRGDFRWNVAATWYKNVEEIVALSTDANDIANGWFIGSPTRVFYDYEKIGIWQTGDDKPAGVKAGQIKVKDQDASGTITAAADRKVLGSALPKWSSSLSTDVSYKGFSLGAQIFARYGQMINYEYDQLFDPQGTENSSRQDYWTPENPTNSFPRPDASLSKTTLQKSLYGTTLAYRDGSYVKLRAATLAYNLPAGLLSKVGVASARVYVQGKNLLTLSHIPNYDPERAASAAASSAERTVTTSDTSTSNGVGLAPLSNPIPRVIIVGINLGF
ncbi:SusC/RagA family TonB-linked outer membrane protein [Hymenobacter ruricola]|uniref:TonB-dependent receptor n=1 Tax=Hymenobacter ruricola TaxID=2791023 RepID=A0ABS0I4H9_9BACT|nr:TonB-dependent receptor [Hymenobacter ruricola]MBF9221809.1 TonB-dependent receptor [Hymenobacter ruricola]